MSLFSEQHTKNCLAANAGNGRIWGTRLKINPGKEVKSRLGPGFGLSGIHPMAEEKEAKAGAAGHSAVKLFEHTFCKNCFMVFLKSPC
jgi:hypothetical protein